jgi:hypothetical protein
MSLHINQYFQDVIIDVDLRKEILKAEIDNYSDKLIESLKKKQKDCIDISKERNELKEKIELDELIQKINDIEYKLKVKNIDEKFRNLKLDFETNLAKYKNLYTGNKLSLSFFEIPIQEIFRKLTTHCEYVIFISLSFNIIFYFHLLVFYYRKNQTYWILFYGLNCFGCQQSFQRISGH